MPEVRCINFLIKYKFDDVEMKNLSFSKIEQKLKKYFAGKDYIAFAYLFGSLARGKFTPLSDIDIAVYIDQTKIAEDLFRLRLKELAALMNLLGAEQVDLVFLNETPLDLNYRVIRDGKLIFERDKKARAHFWEITVRDYLDWKPFIEKRNQIIREKMKKGDYFV